MSRVIRQLSYPLLLHTVVNSRPSPSYILQLHLASRRPRAHAILATCNPPWISTHTLSSVSLLSLLDGACPEYTSSQQPSPLQQASVYEYLFPLHVGLTSLPSMNQRVTANCSQDTETFIVPSSRPVPAVTSLEMDAR
ncbi:hypothetical protein BDN70DRAFT_663151 [Pholiota conissans]|uniref:Uncharacterized protein n=1 Tax=Pholiota conissans TaxID=109636 RepID=A0A9P5YKA7_9AGAR|nr:hypothetical protein BDN70DRAFT_663151 [Pholiota conissans]